MKVRAILAVRLIGLLLFLTGAWQLIANVLETFREFEPTYWSYYFKNQMLRPGLAMAMALVLWLLSRPLGNLLARRLE